MATPGRRKGKRKYVIPPPIGSIPKRPPVVEYAGTRDLLRLGVHSVSQHGLLLGDVAAPGYAAGGGTPVPSQMKIVKLLGHGAFGEVYLAETLFAPGGNIVESGSSSGRFAVKVLPADQSALADEARRRATVAELDWVVSGRSLVHENLLRPLEAFWLHDVSTLWVLMEYLDCGSVQNVVCKLAAGNRALPERGVAGVVGQVLRGLSFLHAHGQLHRDIKPDNVLMHSNGIVKIGDFGLSLVSRAGHGGTVRATSWAGAPAYFSPERLTPDDSGYGRKSDVWAVGVVAVELISGTQVFSVKDPMELIERVKVGIHPSCFPADASPDFRDFVGCATEVDRTQRWTAEGLRSHQWLRSFFSPRVLSELRLATKDLLKAIHKRCKGGAGTQ
eukprot:Hpha_TRINITY_DN28215_c0_g1::TRINITY_DN28215_c0_g1_i1::g.116714::m.116714/K04409/PAK1; p21-activated kinase 1